MRDNGIDMNEKTILVTGASGFIASYIVKDLLARQYRVRGTVRSLRNPDSQTHLLALPGAAERLELAEADLLTPGSFDQAAQGCDAVIHTASPYKINVEDPQKDLVEPAVSGTRHILEAAAKSATVKRVVLTSSMAAVTDEPEEDHVLTEADWNTKSSLERNPYYYSKTVAEREAWAIMEQLRPGYDLVTINPFLVIGPALTKALNPSNQLFADMLTGVFPGIMNMVWGFVDVRDVAQAHVRAMETPAAKGRYLCAGGRASMREVTDLLRQNGYAGYQLPKLGLDCAAGDFVVKRSSYLQPKGVGDYMRSHVGRTPNYDTSKIRRELGTEFRETRASILETVDDLLRWGHVKPAAVSATA